MSSRLGHKAGFVPVAQLLTPTPIFLEGDPLGQFAINQVGDEWRISSRKTLDREHVAKYLLRVTASDGKFQASVPVEVFVLDINDNSPRCSQVSLVRSGVGSRPRVHR